MDVKINNMAEIHCLVLAALMSFTTAIFLYGKFITSGRVTVNRRFLDPLLTKW